VKKTILVVTVFLTVAMLLVFSAHNAMARDGILFPYFSSGNGDLTFIQIGNGREVIDDTKPGKLNYVYVYNTDTEVCQHYDDLGNTTQYDILLYEVTDSTPGATGQLLPGDTTSTSPILPVSPAWGYLVVAQADNYDVGGEGSMGGQATIVNVNTGSAVKYNAINDPDEVDVFYFNSNHSDGHVLSWLPEDYASTVWYFFPVSWADSSQGLVDLTDPDRSSGIVWNSTDEIGYDNEGVYNNNESLKSGTKYLMVGCWDTTMDVAGDPIDPPTGPDSANFFYTLAEIFTGAQYNAVRHTGGWTDVYWHTSWGYPYKFVSSSIMGKPMSAMVFEPGYGFDEVSNSYTK
jgi:hypothetical protein